MKRTIRSSLCVLLLLAVTCPILMADPTAGDSAQPNPDAPDSQRIPAITQGMQLIPTRLDASIGAWATRYPKAYRSWKDSVHGKA